ncbi:hypothetical protein GJ496_000242 [Pomphorhynchus laevis]|nr:hypothetical protein GJ496_000242 [Pomphorhynchus laevis]
MLSGVKYLRLDYNLIERVEPHFVLSNNFRLLSLKGNRIRQFHMDSNTLIWLHYLDLSNNILSTVKILRLKNFELRLTGNSNDFELECNTQLTDLRFNGLQSHQVAQKKIYTAILLSCSHNLIRTINENFFASAIKLEKLDLSHNRIDRIPNGFLSSKHTISHVNLSFNMITAVHLTDFYNMLGLQDMRLFGNPITEIPSGFLNLSSQLKSFSITLNHLQCPNINGIFNQIEEIRFSGCAINIKDYFGLDKLTYIELKSTVLTDWVSLHGTTGATTISILRSNVSSMNFLYRVNASYLVHLNLSFNRIVKITKAQLPKTYNLKSLDLSGNGIQLISDFVYLFKKSTDYLNIIQNYNPTERQFSDYLDNLLTLEFVYTDYNINLLMLDLINSSGLPQILCLHSMCIPGKHIERVAIKQSIGNPYGYTCPTMFSKHNEFKYLKIDRIMSITELLAKHIFPCVEYM